MAYSQCARLLYFHNSQKNPHTRAARADNHRAVQSPREIRENIVSCPVTICNDVINNRGATHTSGKRIVGQIPIPISPAQARTKMSQQAGFFPIAATGGSRSHPALIRGNEPNSSFVLSTAGSTVENGTVA